MSLITPDSYDKLFCRCNGSGTSFADDSTENPKTITANGGAKQITLHNDFNGARTAGFFNGTSDYVVVPDSADWDFGTGDFEIEFYVNWTVLQQSYILNWNGNKLALYYDAGHLKVAQADNFRIDYTWTPTLNTWYKIKIARVSGTTTLYKDDVSVGTPYAGSDNINTGTTGLYIGRYAPASQQFSGMWMKNLTITKASTTVLDMKFDSLANVPLGPAIYFDGTGDFLDVSDATGFDFGTGDFTAEMFVRFTTVASTFFMDGLGGNTFSLYYNSGNLTTYLGAGAKNFTWITPTAGVWYHIAVVRSSGTVKVYVNGIALDAGQEDTTSIDSTGLTFGRQNNSTAYFTGSMREIRVSNVARYTAAFTPAQSGFTVDANTKLYIKGDEDNGETTFIDSETTPKTVTTNGDTKIGYTEDYRSCIFADDSASAHKPYPQGSAKVDFFSVFGAGAGYFDGSGDYLSVPDSTDFDFSGGVVTMEAYVRPSSLAASMGIWAQKTDTNNYMALRTAITTGIPTFTVVASGSEVVALVSSVGLAVNTWAHIAVVEDGDSYKIFINGTDVTASGGTDSDRMANYSGTFVIGRDDVTAGYEWTGFMNNVRISKGVARYSAAFNPPEDIVISPSYNKGEFFAFF